MCGMGTLKYTSTDPQLETACDLGYNDYMGTFCNGMFHGIGKQEWKDFVYEGEFKEGQRHGRATVYQRKGDIFNSKWKDGVQLFKKKINNKSEAWFGDGKPASNEYFKKMNKGKKRR